MISLAQRLRVALNTPMIRNAGWIFLVTVMASAGGFHFWHVASRRHPSAVVGAASAIVALIPLLSTIGGLGLGPAVTGFYAHATDLLVRCGHRS